jgi:hypothetical protein
MFDLDQSIAQWRQQMIAGGLKSPHVLDELESHLRDDVEQQERGGLGLPQAFETAVQRLGQAAALEFEFEKVGETVRAPERARQSLLTLAGIPNHYLDQNMNTSSTNIEPRWATYLKASAFLLPAVCLWLLSIVFLIPKLQQICAHAGGVPLPTVIQVMMSLTEHGLLISGAIVLAVVLLEWRFNRWPRYRRAAVGCGTFVVNAVVLISIFMMVVAAILAAPALMQHAR